MPIRHPRRLAVACLLGLVLTLHAQPASPPNQVALPLNRLNEPWWAARHQAILDAAKQHADTQLLMLGDSITQNYEKSSPPDENFQPTWQRFYAPRNALNLGFSGDTTQNLLWRLDHGEVEGLHPKAAVLLIGTNNTGAINQSPTQTEVGIDAVIADLERRIPATRILLLALLPRDVSPAKSAADQEVNRYLASAYEENPVVTYLDIGSIFFKQGKLDTSQFYDTRLPHPRPALHPDTAAQGRMAEAIEPTLAKLLGTPPQVPLDQLTDINTALIPVPRLEQDSYDWFARHHAELAEAPAVAPETILIGDSITHFWAGPPYAQRASGQQAWHETFGDVYTLNLGFGWDRTQNVLWRLRQGELRTLHPTRIILNIGTNNLTGTSNARANTPEEIAETIGEICQELLTALPQSHIDLMAIFPRGPLATSPLRAPITATNTLLRKRFKGNPSVTLIDLASSFVSADGSLPATLMPDGTHPSNAGYEIWGRALRAMPQPPKELTSQP